MFKRPYLRTPRKAIIQIIKKCRRKRQEFIKAANCNFVPVAKEDDTSRPSGVCLVPPDLDKNLTDVEKIHAIYDWMEYNERKQDNDHDNTSPGVFVDSITILQFIFRRTHGYLC